MLSKYASGRQGGREGTSGASGAVVFGGGCGSGGAEANARNTDERSAEEGRRTPPRYKFVTNALQMIERGSE